MRANNVLRALRGVISILVAIVIMPRREPQPIRFLLEYLHNFNRKKVYFQ